MMHGRQFGRVFLVLEALNKKSCWHVYCMGDHWLPDEFGIPVITQVEKIQKKEDEKEKKGKEDIQKESIQEINAGLWKLNLVPFKK
jgi:hypothetical protein